MSIHDKLEDIWEGKNLTLNCSGDNGQGILATEYGDGGYLDTKAIGKAHLMEGNVVGLKKKSSE